MDNMENQDNRNTEEEMDTASEAKAGEEDGGVEIPVEDGNLEEENGAGASEEETEEAQNESDSAEDEGADGADASGGAKEGFFRKKKKDKKEEAMKTKIDELEDRVKRQMAEFDNFRKRTEKEKSSMFEMGASDMIKKLLPIVDNFERGFNSISEEERETPFAKGMDMVYKQTMKMLEDSDVKPIEALGMEFNPELHNAVMHVEDDSVGEGIIVEEFEKGYTYRETVIRHSMVKVAN